MDAITILRNDHREVEKLFKQVLKAGDDTGLQELGSEIIKELSVHAAIEEQVFYPAVLQALPRQQRALVKSLEAHHAAKTMLAEIDRLAATSDRYRAKLEVLIDSVRQHIAEEEEDLFPRVRDALRPKDLQEIGELLDQAKKVAPTKPHPHAPDTPPANFANLAISIVDRARTAGEEAVRKLTKRGGAAKAEPSGKKAATRVTPSAKKATRAATKAAPGGANKAARRATGSAKKAVRRATGSAKKGTTTAKKAATKSTKKR